MTESHHSAPQTFHIPISVAAKAVDVLAAATGFSKQKIKTYMQQGAVWLSRDEHVRRIRRANTQLNIGDQLHFYFNEKLLATKPAQAVLVADEGQYSVWYKPYGMQSQGSKWSDHCTIRRWVEVQLQPQRPAFIVHRLDRATTGLILIAHSKQAAKSFSALFESRAISKKYKAIVQGRLQQPVTVDLPVNDKAAISHFKLLAYDERADISLLDVEIETGRKHQIRQHLQALGQPVLGDRLYGSYEDQDFLQPINLQLSAYSLSFVCPLSQQAKQYFLAAEWELNLAAVTTNIYKPAL